MTVCLWALAMMLIGVPAAAPESVTWRPPNGRITISQLVAAGMNAGFASDYGCEKRIGSKPAAPADGDVFVARIGYANLDSDASLETVVEVRCSGPVSYFWRLLAFERNRSGAIVQLGRVAGGWADNVSLTSFSARPNGRLGIVLTKWDALGFPVAEQTREFRWNGSKFVQVSGPTKF